MTSITVNAVAERWGCSGKFVRSQIKTGALASWKLGGKLLRIRIIDVEAYEARQLELASAIIRVEPLMAVHVDYAQARLMRARNQSSHGLP